MRIVFNGPITTLRCRACDAVVRSLNLSHPRIEAEIPCVCAVPQFELVFSAVRGDQELTTCPLVPR